MKRTATKKPFDHNGSSFDTFLEKEGIREEAETVAIKRVLAWQLEQAMQKQRKTKQAMAKELHTSRSQLDRLLDPQNVSVSLQTITRAARVLGKRVTVRITDARGSRTRHPRAAGRATAPQRVRATRSVAQAVLGAQFVDRRYRGSAASCRLSEEPGSRFFS